jgi:uracil phosphoribosyltransferase
VRVHLVEHRPSGAVIYTPVVDQVLDEFTYAVPGLGDFGDRLYGTV